MSTTPRPDPRRNDVGGVSVDLAPVPRQRRPGGRNARVRAAAIAATLDILTESGPMGLTVAAVAARAQIHPASIYRRWRTKEGLVLDALAQGFDDAVPIPDTGSLQADLVAFAGLFARFLATPLGTTLGRTASATLSPEFAEARRTMFARQTARARFMIQRAVDRGEIVRPDRPGAAIEAIIGPLLVRAMIGAPCDESFARPLARFAFQALSKSERRDLPGA